MFLPARLLDPLLYSNLWLAGSASGFAAATLVACDLPLDAAAIALPSMVMFAVYSADKCLGVDFEADTENDPERSAFLQRWSWHLIGAASLALIAGGIWAGTISWLCLGLYALPPVVLALYSLRWLPEGLRYRRLKEIPLVKNLSVGLTWGITTTLLPLVASDAWSDLATLCAQGQAESVMTGQGASAGLALLLLVMVSWRLSFASIIFDLGDEAGDREAGVETLPVLFGASATIARLRWANFLFSALLLTAAYLLEPARDPSLLILAGALLDEVALIAAQRESISLGRLCDVWVDGQGLLLGAIALLWKLLG